MSTPRTSPAPPSSPARSGRRSVVTGAASGIGLETALQLAALGDHVIVADRNAAGAEQTVRRVREEGGSAELREIDLADLERVRAFAEHELAQGQPLDVLVNNAGLLPPHERATTRDGFELELGIAHLGHFALTALLWPALQRSPAPRVVSVASLAHANGRIDFDDLQLERRYSASAAYSNTKLACLLFAVELDRRVRAAGLPLVSVAAHPGISTTPIAAGWEREERRRLRDRLELLASQLSMRFLGQTAAEGAQSLVFAATDPGVVGGGYYGPTGFQQISGPPGRVKPSRRALDSEVAARLWEASEALTGVRFELAKAASTGASNPVEAAGREHG